MNNKKLIISFRIILGSLFVYAGVRKILEPMDFADAVAGFKVLPSMLIHPVALGMPFFEVILGLMVILPWRSTIVKIGALGLIIRNISFIAILSSAWMRGLSVSCGCFGFGLFPPSEWDIEIAIVRDIFFLTMAYLSYRFGSLQKG